MLIEVKGAIKKYGKGSATVYALNDVSFSLNQGEICVILGPSGSGKSTLLNMLGGLDNLDSGEINIAGCRVDNLDKSKLTDYRRENLGFIFQYYNLIPDLTVRENVEVVTDICKDSLEIDEVLSALEIIDFKNRFPKELSGGQQQRVAIARAMVKKPKLLLCDELTGALDSKSSLEVLKFVIKMNEKYGTTTIIITHNEAIQDIADRIIKIKDGKIMKNELNKNKKPVEEVEL
ncbi:ABC transporter ATP-binding protein [Clostridium sp. LP20]|uniref:ABC transporter ATP-binding protein n=1 Tax=Clostridium sp. LP20 TaxID=3418665 RepID=UPI003EE80FB7